MSYGTRNFKSTLNVFMPSEYGQNQFSYAGTYYLKVYDVFSIAVD